MPKNVDKGMESLTVTFLQTQIEAALPRYLRYAAGFRLTDTYWEDYIYDATIYDIICDEIVVGNFSIYEPENMLTSFLLDEDYIICSEEIFSNIIEDFSVTCGYVTTNDELMLSLCMEFQTTVKLQAFFFDDTNLDIKEAEFPKEFLRVATDDDIQDLIKQDFFHPLYINNEEDLIYVMRNEKNEFMGAGHIRRMRLARQWGAVGMAVDESFRNQGVGRSIIIHLKEITKKRGLIPIAGCWCKNIGSKKTLESCGFSAKTRLLKVFFKEEQIEEYSL